MKRLFIIILAASLLFLSSCNTKNEVLLPAEETENIGAASPFVVIEAPTLQSDETETEAAEQKNIKSYVLNERSHKIHKPSCYSAAMIAEHNKTFIEADLQELLTSGYTRCGNCNPD